MIFPVVAVDFSMARSGLLLSDKQMQQLMLDDLSFDDDSHDTDSEEIPTECRTSNKRWRILPGLEGLTSCKATRSKKRNAENPDDPPYQFTLKVNCSF